MNQLAQSVMSCRRCDRLRSHCSKVAQKRKPQYFDQEYWGKPVPGFGDASAWLWVVGLAPGAHGANRTGRVFTGDNSGLWLYRAIFKAGLSNTPVSLAPDDRLILNGTYVSCVVKCAPPGNKPTPLERDQCSRHLLAELAFLKELRVILALGKFAWDSVYSKLLNKRPTSRFSHGAVLRSETITGKSVVILGSYHPSQQNTFTKKLTQPMFDEVFKEAINYQPKM